MFIEKAGVKKSVSMSQYGCPGNIESDLKETNFFLKIADQIINVQYHVCLKSMRNIARVYNQCAISRVLKINAQYHTC
jgi:hypothetical protein